MARLEKLLLRTGIYQAPQGKLVASKDRMARWARRFKDMTAAGLKVPVAWGHQPDAVPGDADDRAARQYYLSRFNAGYLEDLKFDPATGAMTISADCPGLEVDDKGNAVCWTRLPDGREVKTAVGEVSAAIRPFRDGKGREWDDAVVHVAITPLPVFAGQTGFKALPGDGNTFTLSLADWSGAELSTEGDDMAEDKADDKAAGEEGGKGGDWKKVLEILAKHGLALPDDTDASNFEERLTVADTALQGGEDKGASEEDDLDDFEEDDAAAAGAEPETRPVMLSLSTEKDPKVRKLLEGRQAEHKEKLLTRLRRLQKRGMPPHEAAAYREQLAGYELSLDGDHEPVQKPVEFELSVWEKVLPKKALTEGYLRQRSERVVRHDEPQSVSQDEINRRAAAVSVSHAPRR
jgi:hypothetical protein